MSGACSGLAIEFLARGAAGHGAGALVLAVLGAGPGRSVDLLIEGMVPGIDLVRGGDCSQVMLVCVIFLVRIYAGSQPPLQSI